MTKTIVRRLLKAARLLTANDGPKDASWDLLARKIIDHIKDSRFSWEDAVTFLDKAATRLETQDQDHEWHKQRGKWYVRSLGPTIKGLYKEKLEHARDDIADQLMDALPKLGRRAERTIANLPGMHLDELFETGVEILDWDDTDMDTFFENLGFDPDDIRGRNQRALDRLKEMNDGRLFRTSAKWYFLGK